jgi:hypothetical protein
MHIGELESILLFVSDPELVSLCVSAWMTPMCGNQRGFPVLWKTQEPLGEGSWSLAILMGGQWSWQE